MTNQRGFTLVELLVASAAAGILALGLASVYLLTTVSMVDADAQAALQSQGTLVLNEIAQRVQSATNLSSATACGGQAATSVQLTGPDPANPGGTTTYCYYAGSNGELYQCKGSSTTCWNLLAGSLKTVKLLQQTAPPDPLCPGAIAAGDYCLQMPCIGTCTPAVSGTRVDVVFSIFDRYFVDRANFPDRYKVSFSTTLTCVGRGC